MFLVALVVEEVEAYMLEVVEEEVVVVVCRLDAVVEEEEEVVEVCKLVLAVPGFL